LTSPRVRVSALLRWQESILLCRQEKPGKEYWMLPGGGVELGETLEQALRRELGEELGLNVDLSLEGPIAVADSIAPGWRAGDRHVIQIVFACDLSHMTLEHIQPGDAVIRGLRLVGMEEIEDLVMHPPITRFVQRWQSGDPAVYLGSLWAR
jgi:8-oxo-dGTP diphosphatase